MSVFAPFLGYSDNDYQIFDTMGGDGGGGADMMNLGGQYQAPQPQFQQQDYQSLLNSLKNRPPIQLGMQFQQLPDEMKPIRQLEQIIPEYEDQTTVKPKVVTQPVYVQRMKEQPITRVHSHIQPVVKRIIRQKTIRPHIITRTEIRPQIMEQPVVVPKYYDQETNQQKYSEEYVEAPVITLQPTYDNEEVRGAPIFSRLPLQYQQPLQQGKSGYGLGATYTAGSYGGGKQSGYGMNYGGYGSTFGGPSYTMNRGGK
jgi:hypothetical protein